MFNNYELKNKHKINRIEKNEIIKYNNILKIKIKK